MTEEEQEIRALALVKQMARFTLSSEAPSTDPDDAELTLNSLIRDARAIAAGNTPAPHATKQTPVRIVCPQCGSENVHKDAAAAWDAEAQEWTLSSVHDSETCNDCGHEGDFFANRVPIAKSGETELEPGLVFRWMIQGDRIPELWAWLECDHTIVKGTSGFYRTTDPEQALERMRAHVPAAFQLEEAAR